MKVIILFIVLSFSLVIKAQMPNLSDCKNIDTMSVDPKIQTKCASFFMLYQLALKNKKEKLFGDEDLCIDYKATPNGDFKLSIVMNSKAFETGVAEYKYDDPAVVEKYNNLKKTLGIFNDYFKSAGTEPRVTVNAFADPQNNILQKYKTNNPYSIDPENEEINNQSKINNKNLALKRGTNFANQPFYPKDWAKNVIPYHSPFGEDKLTAKQRNCPSRRSVMVDLEFSPFLDFEHQPGKYTPKFSVPQTVFQQKSLIAASATHALELFNKYGTVEDAINSLPKSCQTDSSKKFMENAIFQVRDISKLLNQNISNDASNRIKEEMKAEFGNKYKKKQIFFEYKNAKDKLTKLKNSKNKKDINSIPYVKKYVDYLKGIIEQGEINGSYSAITTSQETLELTEMLNQGADKNGVAPKALISKISRNFSARYRALHHRLSYLIKTNSSIGQSTHGSDCFSTAAFYNLHVDKNRNSFIQPVDKMLDVNGELSISFDKDNMPVDSKNNKPGYFCNQCHSGFHYVEDENGNYVEQFSSRLMPGKQKYPERLKKSAPERALHFDESFKTHEYLRSNSDTKEGRDNLFKFGADKSLRLMLIPGCKTSADGKGFDAEYVQKVARAFAIKKIPFDKNVAGIKPDDCFFKPVVMTACRVEPTGEGQNEGYGDAKQAVKYFNLNKMDMDELIVDETSNILNQLVENVGQLEIMCKNDGGIDVPKLVSPQRLVESLSCNFRGIKAPTPGYNSLDDCSTGSTKE